MVFRQPFCDLYMLEHNHHFAKCFYILINMQLISALISPRQRSRDKWSLPLSTGVLCAAISDRSLAALLTVQRRIS